MLGWTLNMLASARKTWLRWTLQMLASARKTVSLYLIALRLSPAGCSAHSPTAYLTYAKQHETWRTGSCTGRVAFGQVQVSFQILRRTKFCHVPGSKHSKRFFSKSFDSSRNFETTWPYSTRSCSVSWSSTFLNTGRKTTSYTFFHLSTWYHFVAVTVVIGHPTGPLQYFTSHYFALQKKLYSRAF